MSIVSNVNDAVAQAFLPGHLIRRGRDGQRCIPREGASSPVIGGPAVGLVPALHRASPRIAADPCSSRPLAQRLISSASHLARVVRARPNPNFTPAHRVNHSSQGVASEDPRAERNRTDGLIPSASVSFG
jgi:hypothetical protein